MSFEIKTLCLIGAGTMGTGIAQIAAQAGLRVYLIDIEEAALARSRQRLDVSLQQGIERGKLTCQQADEAKSRISWSCDYGLIAKADWIIEAVFEDIEIKRDVWQKIAQYAAVEVPAASNTSTIPIKMLAEFFGRPQWIIGMHFFNPAPAMKLVEIIPTAQTLPLVVETAQMLCTKMGKTPLLAPDIPGFIVNRALTALVAAAIEVWAQGAEPEAIDQALELGLGHKMGPLRTADLIGLDVIKAMHETLFQLTGQERFRLPQRFYDELYSQGKWGVKSGAGFYKYE